MRHARLTAMAAALFLIGLTARSMEHTIVIKEWLDRNWPQQLLTYPFEAPEGACRTDELVLTGPDGPLPVQLHDIETWPDGASVKHARLSFIDDLLARTERTYAVSSDRDAANTPPTDLTIVRTDDRVTVETAALGARFPLGDYTYAEPRSAADVPGPLAALRLPDGTWFGGSELYGPARISTFSARLTGAGPVFAEVTFRYEYEDGNRLDLKVRLAAGDNALFWDADVAQDSPENGWRMLVDEGLSGLLFPVRIENHSQRECVRKGERHPFRYHQPVRDLKVYRLDGDAPSLIKPEPSQYGIGEPGLIYKLTPWNDWWIDYTGTDFELWMPDRQLRMEFRHEDPGAWIDPLPPGQMRSWGDIKPKMMTLRRLPDRRTVFEMNLAAGDVGGVRRWSFGIAPLDASIAGAADIMELKTAGMLRKGPACPRIGRRLNVVKDYVLNWPRDPQHPHPRLFMTGDDIADFRRRFNPDEVAADIMQIARKLAPDSVGRGPERNDTYALAAWLLTGDEALAKQNKLAERLETRLGLLGGFDKMRHTTAVLTLYDGVIDSPLIRAEDRPYLRAQIAYLAYQLTDPGTWSIERGYKSGNANMSISYLTNQGCLAAALRDHPMSGQWMASPLGWIEKWLTDYIGPKGEWRESHHYVHVSFDAVMAFVVAAKHAGARDFFADSDLKQLFLYLGKMLYTPPDPQRHGHRVTAPMGRRPSGEPWALTGFAARATQNSDPAFSRAMQFIWKGTGFSRRISDVRWGGYEYVYLDPGLPAENPQWGSEVFPWWGAVMHQGFGTEHAHYVNTLLPGHGWKSPGAHGSVVKYFSMGIPVGGAFAGTYDVTPNMGVRQELLQNRVLLARDWTDWQEFFLHFGRKNTLHASALTTQPRVDYLRADMRMEGHVPLWSAEGVKRGMELPPDLVQWPPVDRRGQPPVNWHRQLMFVKSADPRGPGYLVFRDTIDENEPTFWQFWTLSEKLGTPEQAADRASFLADAPGHAPTPPRPVEGNRFTALGQLALDAEYYIAAPTDTPRYTLRYGCATPRTLRHNQHVNEYQDLLQVRMDGAGHYFIVLYPRHRHAAAPEFATLGDGHIIRLTTGQRRDWTFLAAEETSAGDGQTEFEGTAACVQVQPDESVLTLGAPGAVRHGAVGLRSAHPASLHHRGTSIIVQLPEDHRSGGEVSLILAGDWEAAKPADGIELIAEADGYRLTLPLGQTRAVLRPVP